jgi:DNA-directed RNA polymerase specialized sigma24 family protein
MAPSGKENEEAETRGGVFAATHWSVVLAAGQAESPQAAEALEKLCRTYWYPLYAYVRRRGFGHDDAQDLTQGFLLQLLAHKSFGRVDRSKGRFRSFLLGGLNHFLADQRDRANAQKRGGGHSILSLDAQAAEQRYRLEPVDERSPDRLFERAWAMALLDSVLASLEEEFRDAGKVELFERLREFLVAGMEPPTYAEAGAETGMTSEAVRKAVHRLRHRYYGLFREEIARTVADASEVEEEMRYLCDVIAR